VELSKPVLMLVANNVPDVIPVAIRVLVLRIVANRLVIVLFVP
jgi:hypothetical protein